MTAPRSRVRSVLLLGLTLLAESLGAQPQADVPRFRSSVDVTSIDVTVVDDRGRPLLDIRPEEFSVRIDNAPRRVVTADWTPLVTLTGPPPPPPPEGYSTNESVSGGRLMLIVIDQPNIRFGATQSIQRAVFDFLDRLQPSDRVAAVAIGPGNASTPFTADRERVKRAVARMSGTSRQFQAMDFDLAQTEAMAIARGTIGALERAMSRQCSGAAFELDACRGQIMAQATLMASDVEMNGRFTLGALRTLLRGLARIDAPKTLLFVSEGFPIEDERATVNELGALAGAARTSIYAVRLDNQLFDAADPRLPSSPVFDRAALADSMESLAAASRGVSLTITGSGASAFERIESELSGFYMVGVEASPADKDGAAHPIRVEVSRKGATVRFRRVLRDDGGDPASRTPRQAVAAALSTPLPLAALPLKAAAFSLLGPERDRVQMLIHTDIGSGYTDAARVSLAYYITDADGRIVDSRSVDAPLPPVMKGVPSPLQYVTGASLPAGEYTFKLAAADGDKVGTVEHTFRAGVGDAAGIRFSDLIVGGPLDGRDLGHPSVSHLVSFGSVQGYVEVYGAGLERLSVRFELAATPDGPALVDRPAAPRRMNDSRTVFSEVLLTQKLPPGRYVVRAIVSAGAEGTPTVVKTLTRGFEVAPPRVLMTSANSVDVTASPLADLYLPVGDHLFARPFAKGDVLAAPTLKRFRERVAPTALPVFDQAVAALAAGELERAERTLKEAVQADADSTPILNYLAAVYAAAGQDRAAAGAWQTALIGGADLPELYVWLADTLLRSRELAQARPILEEAVAQWPGDPRFAKPLALTYATFGRGREAVRMLERHLAAQPGDREALALAVEWIYHLRVLGATAHSPREDRALARRYADAYLKAAKGQPAALVRQWMAYIEK